MNELLLWMSVRRSGSDQSFRAKVADVEPGNRSSVARHRLAAWDLSRLGHAEFGQSSDGAGWRIAPPVLASGDHHGPSSAILCGARTSAIMTALAAGATACQVSILAQRQGPDVIRLVAPNASALAVSAARAGISLQWNAPLAILAACRSPKSAVLQPIAMPVGGWTVSRFSKSELAWVESTMQLAARASSGLFRFKAEHGTAYVLVEEGRSYACDPSEAKYRIFRRRNRPLSHSSERQEFAVSMTCRPPALIERALVLCSGHLPALRDGNLIYTGIGRPVALAAASLLGQRLN